MADRPDEAGPLVLETVAKIRRAYFVQRKPIKAICRELRVSGKVVRKVLRSEATEFHYERGEQPLPRIGPWQDALDQLLASNEAKPGRERLTLIRIFEALRGLGYEGGYEGADLSDALGLSETQFAETHGDASTKLPGGLARPRHWPATDVTPPSGTA